MAALVAGGLPRGGARLPTGTREEETPASGRDQFSFVALLCGIAATVMIWELMVQLARSTLMEANQS